MRQAMGLARCAFAALALGAPAAGQLVPVDGRGAIEVAEQRVVALVEDGLARTTVRQRFESPYEGQLEAVFVFRVPEGASLVDLALEVGGQRLEGLLAERQRARRVYDEVVRGERDPALVEQIGAGRFRLSVFPVTPDQPTVVELSWIEPLPLEGGALRYVCPLAGEGAPPRAGFVDITLRAPFLHELEVSRADAQVERSSPGEARVTLETRGGAEPDEARELVVLARPLYTDSRGPALRVKAFRGADGDGWFHAFVATPAPDPESLAPREVVLVLDTSGSMQGEAKLEAAKRSALWLLRHLRPKDYVNVLRFSSDVEAFAERPVAATPEQLARLEAFVGGFVAEGGTALGDALARALTRDTDEPERGRARSVVLLTDGKPTVGERSRAALIERAAAARGQRLFVFGVGGDVDAGLLRGLAAAADGAAELFLPGSEIEARLTGFLARTATPVLTDLELELDGLAVRDVLPRALPDLYAGEPLAITGRYRDGGAARVRLTGWRGEERLQLEVPIELPATPSGSRSVMQLHARAKLDFLEEQRRLRLDLADDAYYAALDRGAYSTADEIVEEMIAVSLESGVQCAYTSFLALLPEDRARLDPRDLEALEAARERARSVVGGEVGSEPSGAGLELWDGNFEQMHSTASADPDFLTDSPFDDRAFNDEIGVGGGASGRYAGRFGERRSLRAAGGLGTEEPLRDALAGLARARSEDGSWGGEVEPTALALLALLGDGQTTRTGLHREPVLDGIRWLRERQDYESGRFRDADLRAHALATLAVTEAYFFSRSPVIRGTVQKALGHLQRELRPVATEPETLGWSALALGMAREAGLSTDAELERAVDARLGELARGGEDAPIALAALHLRGASLPSAEEQAALLQGLDPAALPPAALFWASAAAFQLGGEAWSAWNAHMKPALIDSQLREGAARGSWSGEGDGVRATALRALTLEVYFRR